MKAGGQDVSGQQSMLQQPRQQGWIHAEISTTLHQNDRCS